MSASCTGLSPSLAGFPKTVPLTYLQIPRSETPECTHSGLGSFPFARRYLGNRFFFLFLRLLRCFSSPGSLPYVMYWRMDDWSSSSRVSPFRHPWLTGYLLLPMAFRSLSRLSSALSAKASALRSFLLDLCYNKRSVVCWVRSNLSIRKLDSHLSIFCIATDCYLFKSFISKSFISKSFTSLIT